MAHSVSARIALRARVASGGRRRWLLLVFFLACGSSLAARSQPRTAYTCSVHAVRALGRDFPAFVRLVHPVLGLAYRESGKDLGDGKPFSQAALRANARVPVTASYNDEENGRPVRLRDYLQRIARSYPFAATKDIRRNIRGLSNSTDVFQPAKPGETLVSFHVTDPAQELNWRCLAVRTRVYRGQAYVTGLDYLYWTP